MNAARILKANTHQVFAAVLLLTLSASSALAATREAEVKAAYLYKLASFVTWPGTAFTRADQPFQICVAGRDDIFAILEVLIRSKQAAGHPMTAVYLGSKSAAQARNCHTLFVGQNVAGSRIMLASTARNPVLTVTDRSGGTSGGVIEFVERDGNIRLAIRRQEADARQLGISSKLLAVGEPVEP